MFDTSHLHPMIVHFPIALVIIGFLSDLVGLISKKHFFTSVGLYLIVLGSLGTIAAYFSGGLAGEGVEEFGALETALDVHESAAVLAVWAMVILATLRVTLAVTKRMTGWLQWAMVVLMAVGVGAVARTGYYGGQLVYKHAAGVQLTFGTSQVQEADSQQPFTPGTDADQDD